MGDFSKSVKKTLAQVFGRGDLEEVLNEDWEFLDSQEMSVLEAGTAVPPTPVKPAPPPSAPRPTDLKALVDRSDSHPAEAEAPDEQQKDESKEAPSPPQTPKAEGQSVSSATTVPDEMIAEGPADAFGTIELPPSETHEGGDALSRAVQMITDEGSLPETESFIRELGFGGADAPYPSDLGTFDEEEDAPAPKDTLDITGIFEDFVASDDDPFEGLHGPDNLNEIAAEEAEAVVEPQQQEPQEPEPAVPPTNNPMDIVDGAPPLAETESSMLDFPLDEMALDAFDSSLMGSSFLAEQTSDPVIDSGLIENGQPSVIQTAHTDSIEPAQAEESQRVEPPESEDTGRVLSNRGKALFKGQRARGSDKEGPPPADIFDEARTRAFIVRDLRRDAGRVKNPAFRDVLLHLSECVEAQNASLPPFPSAARRLLGVVDEEEVMEIIRSSPSLAGNVVRVANSPFYMSAKPVTSLNAAFMRIGLDQSRRVSLASLVGSSYEVEGFDKVMHRIQLHSIATASTAEMIATTSQLSKEEAFLGGLLHDAGMVLTYRLVKASNDATGSNWLVDQGTLRRMARKYHQRLGALFLSGWDLPASVATMMAYHHHPDEADQQFLTHAKLIHVADALAERAVRHSRHPKWKRAMDQRDPEASDEERSRASEVDGVQEISVHDLLFQAPKKLDVPAMHGVIRSVLLKLDSRQADQATDDDDDSAETSSTP